MVDSQSQVPYEICAPDADTLQHCNDGIRLVNKEGERRGGERGRGGGGGGGGERKGRWMER